MLGTCIIEPRTTILLNSYFNMPLRFVASCNTVNLVEVLPMSSPPNRNTKVDSTLGLWAGLLGAPSSLLKVGGWHRHAQTRNLYLNKCWAPLRGTFSSGLQRWNPERQRRVPSKANGAPSKRQKTQVPPVVAGARFSRASPGSSAAGLKKRGHVSQIA